MYDAIITDEGLIHLANLPALRQLGLSKSLITDNAVPYLSVLTSLRSLDVRDTQITPSGLNLLKEALPNCRIWSNLANKRN